MRTAAFPGRRRRAGLSAALALALAVGAGVGGAVADTAALGTSGPTSLPSSNAFSEDVTRAPVHASSRAMVSNLNQQVTSRYGGVAAFNVWQYGASINQVPGDQRRVDVSFDDCQRKGYTPRELYGPGGHFEDVPVPADAVPAAGTDGQMTIYSPSTDQLWEFWKARKTSSGWSACWGGRIDRFSRSAGLFPGMTGASASGTASSVGAVRIDEARAGQIDHALALSLPQVGHWKSWSYPAQRSDGSDRRPSAIPMGTRFRLDPSLDVASLGLHPVAEAAARAAQRYGLVVTDTAGAVALTAESGDTAKARTGTNPWYGILGGTGSYAVLEGFPWSELQAVEAHWGAPS